MTAVRELWDAGSPVAGPAPVVDDAGRIEALRAEAGVTVRAISWAVEAVVGHDPLTELLEWVAGDFSALASMQQGWLQAAASLDAVARNQIGLAGQLPEVWRGEAADAADDNLARQADVAARQAEASRLVSEQLGHALAASTSAAEAVCACLKLVDDIVAGLILKAAAGPAGVALAALKAPAEAGRLLTTVRHAQQAIAEVVETIAVVGQVLVTIKTTLDALAVLSESLAAGSHARAGAMADETAEAGF